MSRALTVALLLTSCAGDPSPRRSAITQGTPDSGDPAVVALRVRMPECGTPPIVYCTGTLVGPRAVITAAHCLKPAPVDQVEVCLGADARAAGEVVRAASFFPHPDESVDLAVIALAAEPSAPVLAVRSRPIDTTVIGTTARLIGYGADDEMMVGLKREGTATVEAVNPTTFRVRAAPSQSCDGDSGGPVLLEEELAGVVSYGDPACAHTGTQVRLDLYAAFISETLAQIAAEPPVAPAHDPLLDPSRRTRRLFDVPALMNIKNKSILAGLVTYPLLGALLFGAAGTLHWLAGWTFIVFFSGGCVLLTRWLLVHDPDLVEERMRIGKNQKGWDKFFLAAINVFFLAWYVVMPLDAVRYRWSHVPVWLRAGGVVLTLASFRIFFVTFRENPFLSGVVRIQEERGHKVISTGPYRFVRHPMYAGALLLFIGAPLWLGSWWGVAVGALFSVLIAVRAVLEERTLARELPGYDDYRRKVRDRLVPFVW